MYLNHVIQRLKIVATLFLVITGFLFGSIEEIVAQTATVQGIITDQETAQTLEGANVVMSPISSDDLIGRPTDLNGFYQFTGLAPGTYTFRISYLGFVTYQDTLSLVAGEIRTISREMAYNDTELDDVVVSVAGGAARIQAGRQRVSAADLRRVPTPAGSGDLVSYLQALPGVVASGDRGGQLYIRGGTPAENMVLLDGTLIYQPFHIVGFFSVFPEDLVSSADVYAGGFGPRYAGRISSVVDVKMRDGNRYETNGFASVSPFLGEVFIEGPLREGRASFIASARRSLIEESSPMFLSERQPLRFESQYFKASHYGVNDTRCSATGLRTYDRGQLDYEDGEMFRWSNFVLGGRCVILPAQSDLLFDMNAGFSHVSNAVGNSDDPDRFSKVIRFNMDVNLTQYIRSVRMNYGGYVRMKLLNYDMSEQFHEPQSDRVHVLSGGGYIEAGIPLGERVEFNPGAVLTMYRDLYPISFEPRMRISWQPWGSENQEMNFAAGVYHQSLVGITDNRDASSLFTAWMPNPIGDEQLKAIHLLLGWQQSIGGGVQVSIEGFHKRLTSIPVSIWSTLASFTTDLTLADGTIYGGDVRLEVNRMPFYGFIGYGYSLTEYTSAQDHFNDWFGEPVQKYHPPHDRRHQLNALMSVELGKYTIGARWQFGTGLPFTRPIGFDEILRFNEHLPSVRQTFGTPRVILDRPYKGRTPTYHRLDVSMERSFTFEAVQLNLQLGVINAYDHSNIFYYDVYTHRRIDQLPFAPYISLKLDTR